MYNQIFNIILVATLIFGGFSAAMAIILAFKKYNFIPVSNRIKETKYNQNALSFWLIVDVVIFGCLLFMAEFGVIFNYFDAKNQDSNPIWSFFVTIIIVFMIMIGYGALIGLIYDLACRLRFHVVERNLFKKLENEKPINSNTERILRL